MRTTCLFWRPTVLLSFASALSGLAACGSDGPTAVSESPARTQISWQRCDIAGVAVQWLAVQDGTGPWRRVTESSGAFAFVLDSARAGVAYVASSELTPSLFVRFYTAAELQNAKPLCSGMPRLGTKRVSGTVTLGSLESSDIALAHSEGYASGFGGGPSPFTLDRVENGAADLIAVRRSVCPVPSTCAAATGMIIRRNIEPTDGSTLPRLDFSDTREAFQLVPRTLTVQGLSNGEAVDVEESFSTATTPIGVTLMYPPDIAATASSARVAYYSVPDDKLVSGDLHQVFISAQSTDADRETVMNLFSPKDQTVTLGSALPPVNITTSHSATGATISAQLTSGGGFRSWAGEFVQRDVDVVVRASAGYVRSGSVNLTVPNLTGVAGWLPSWGLQSGVATRWSAFGISLAADTIEATTLDRVPPYQAAGRSGLTTP